MNRLRLIQLTFVLLLTFVSSISVHAQSADGAKVHFRLIETQIDTEYLSNSHNLKLIEKLISGRCRRIDSLSISAWSSPEGSPYLNASLAEKRASALEELILKTSDGTLNRA